MQSKDLYFNKNRYNYSFKINDKYAQRETKQSTGKILSLFNVQNSIGH